MAAKSFAAQSLLVAARLEYMGWSKSRRALSFRSGAMPLLRLPAQWMDSDVFSMVCSSQ